MSSSKIAERRLKIQTALEQRKGMTLSLRVLARDMGLPRRIVVSDVEWLEKNRGATIEHPERDTVVFRGFSGTPASRESRSGRIYPILGMCDNCREPLILDGHRRFCTDICREVYMGLAPREREIHEMRGIMLGRERGTRIETIPNDIPVEAEADEELAMPTPEEFAEKSKLAAKLFKESQGK